MHRVGDNTDLYHRFPRIHVKQEWKIQAYIWHGFIIDSGGWEIDDQNCMTWDIVCFGLLQNGWRGEKEMNTAILMSQVIVVVIIQFLGLGWGIEEKERLKVV